MSTPTDQLHLCLFVATANEGAATMTGSGSASGCRKRWIKCIFNLENHILRNVLDARVGMEGHLFEHLAASDYAAFDGLVRDTLSLRHG